MEYGPLQIPQAPSLPSRLASRTASYFNVQSVTDGKGNTVNLGGGGTITLRSGAGPWTFTSVGTNTNGAVTYENNPAITVVANPGCPKSFDPVTPSNTIRLNAPSITSIKRTLSFDIPLYFGAERNDQQDLLAAFPISSADIGHVQSAGFQRFTDRDQRFWTATGSVGGETFTASGDGRQIGPFSAFIPFPGISTLSFSVTWKKGSYVTSKTFNPSNPQPIYLPNDVTYSWTVCIGDCPRSPTESPSGSSGFVNDLEPNASSYNCPGGGGYYSMMPSAAKRVALGLPPKMLGAGGGDDDQLPAPSLSEPFRAANLLTPGKIRVGMICPDLNQAGAENHQLELMSETASLFDWVGLVCTGSASRANEAMLAATSKVVPVAFGLDKVASLAAQVDVLVTWSILDFPKWTNGATTPIIFIDHFPHDEPFSGVTRWCLRDVTKIVGVSELCLPGVPKEWASKSVVLWNAVDEDKLVPMRDRKTMRALWGVPANARVAGFYGRRAIEKRPDAMIRLAAALPSDWHVVLIGESRGYPDESEALALQIAGLPPDVAKRIHLLPPDPATGDVLNAFDVLVNPPEVESFGLMMAEALWMGVPVVATPAGIAKLNPSLVYGVRLDASGSELAAATLKARASGPRLGSQAFAKLRFSTLRFKTEWSTLISTVAGRPLGLPSLVSQAVGFAGAMVKHIGAGGGIAAGDVQAARLAICATCPFYLADADRCSRCGCGMTTKASLPRAITGSCG